jgi:hypothetical protein
MPKVRDVAALAASRSRRTGTASGAPYAAACARPAINHAARPEPSLARPILDESDLA